MRHNPRDQMPKDDPNAAVPAAVRAAGAKADELYKQVYQPQDPPADPPADPEPQPPAPAPEPAPAPAPVTPPGNDGDEESWKHKYQSIHGRLRRQDQTIREQADQITNLQALIATIQTQSAAPAPKELQASSFLTPEEIENFGPEFIEVVGKRAKEIVTPEVAALRQQVADLEKKLAGVGTAVTKGARQKLLEQLDDDVPNWTLLNEDPKFLAWLGLRDPFSGAIRHELLNTAFEQNDTPRVLAFFKGFLAEEAATAPAPAAEPDPATQVAKVPLEALAAPGRAKTAAPSTPAEKPIITRAQISQFYVDIAAGKYRGREDEKARLEQEIFAATREGRIR
jgi:hypothetical protein